MKNIYILDDHPIITEGIAQLLSNNQQYQITAGHHDSELYNYLNDHTPDLLIIDYEIQDKTALDVITYLQKKGMNIPQLIYTMHTEFWIIKLLIKGKHSVNHVFSSPTSIINFTSKKPSYDDTRRSGRDNELLQRAQNDL